MPAENLTKDEEKAFHEVVDAVRKMRQKFFADIRKQPKKKRAALRVKKALPEFVGPDMKIYRLGENEIVDLPKELEELLLKQGVVERVEVDENS